MSHVSCLHYLINLTFVWPLKLNINHSPSSLIKGSNRQCLIFFYWAQLLCKIMFDDNPFIFCINTQKPWPGSHYFIMFIVQNTNKHFSLKLKCTCSVWFLNQQNCLRSKMLMGLLCPRQRNNTNMRIMHWGHILKFTLDTTMCTFIYAKIWSYCQCTDCQTTE